MSQKSIKAYLDFKVKEEPKVKVVFSNEPYTPEEFIHLFMGILETYTEQLLSTNPRLAIYENFNNVFGIFLKKLATDEELYAISDTHKKFKEHTDSTLGAPFSADYKKQTEENRLAAYLLTRDILVTEIGLTEPSADLILNKRLGLIEPIKLSKPKELIRGGTKTKDDSGE